MSDFIGLNGVLCILKYFYCQFDKTCLQIIFDS